MNPDYVLMQIRSEKCIRIMFWCRSALKNRSGLCFDADLLWKMDPVNVLMQICPEKWIRIMFWCRSALKNGSGLCLDVDLPWKMDPYYVLMQIRSEKWIRIMNIFLLLEIMKFLIIALVNRWDLCFKASEFLADFLLFWSGSLALILPLSSLYT